jgi:membrane protein required for colicin V production
MTTFTTLDLVLLGVIGAAAVRGWFTGATRQLVSTVGWFVGFVLAAALMGPVGGAVVESLGVSPRTAPVLGFVVVFAAALAAVALAGHAVRKVLEAVKLGGVDRLLGAVLAGLKGALGMSVVLMVTAFSPVPGGSPWLVSAETRARSALYEPVRALAPEAWRLVQAVTPGVQQILSDKFNTWDEERRKREAGAPPEEEK